MYPTLEERFDAAMAKADGYRVLEIDQADPTIGVVPQIAAAFFSIMRRARFNRTAQCRNQLKREAVDAVYESECDTRPILNPRQELGANRILTLVCRC